MKTQTIHYTGDPFFLRLGNVEYTLLVPERTQRGDLFSVYAFVPEPNPYFAALDGRGKFCKLFAVSYREQRPLKSVGFC
jgi:hypothetical protein